MDEENYLKQLRKKLLRQSNFRQLAMTREWAATVPAAAGVYVFKDKDSGEIIYAGETGNLRGRMNDLQKTRQHTLRRSIGAQYYSAVRGFVKATTKNKFPDHIESLVNKHLCEKLLFSCIEVSLGRKELEEMIIAEIDKSIRLNKLGKRQ